MCKAKELQARIEQLRKDISSICSTHTNSTSEISKKQAEIIIAASQLAEISTRRIVWLTLALLAFTAALLGMEIRKLFVEKNPDTAVHETGGSQHEQILVPAITNRNNS
jgi:hypothetical protein